MNELDKAFRNKLNHHSADIPEGMWNQIDNELQKQERRLIPSIFGISSILLGFVALTVGSYFMLPVKAFDTNHTQETHHIFPETNTKITSQPLASIYQGKSTETLSINDSETAISPIENTTLKTTDRTIKGRYTHKQRENAFPSISKSSKVGDTNGTSTIGQISAEGGDPSNMSMVKDMIIGTKDDITSTDKTKSTDDYNALETNRTYENTQISPLTGNISGLLSNQSADGTFTKRSIKTEPVKACPFNVDYRDKSIDIYYSSDYVDKLLSDREDGAKLKDMRIATETPKYSFSAGVRLGYNLSYRWNIHTGLNYSQINEKFEYTDPESSKIRIVIVKDYIYENGRVVDSIVKQEEVLVPGSSKLTIYNKFRTLDLPILGRYTLLANRHLSLSAVAGIYVNIASFEKGTIISETTHKPVELTRNDNEEGSTVYKNQIGMSLYGSLSLAYHITSTVDMLVEPYARIQPQSVTVATYPLYQKFNIYGLNLGLRYKF